MKFQHIFRKKPIRDGATRIIREEMLFLLEPKEKWFKKNLQNHLLHEGCNYPLCLAQPVFYEAMLTGLCASVQTSLQTKCLESFPFIERIHDEPLSYEEFHAVMRFWALKLKGAEKQIALEVTNSIDRIKQAWQLDANFFQQERPHFDAFVSTTLEQLTNAEEATEKQPLSLELIRRRLYMAFTTSFLRKMNVRSEFKNEFGSIPQVLNDMRHDHAVFCRFMRFCQERSPYFEFIASQTFWRTLETIRLEAHNA